MPVVLLLFFQVVAGIALFIFLLHYLSYIFNAIIRDFCETLLTTKEFLQQLQEAYGADDNNDEPQTSVTRNFTKIPIKVQKMQQTSDDAKFIKKRWKGGSIEPHPTDKALIVNYQLEATVFGEPNNPMLEEKKLEPRYLTYEQF